MAKEYRRICNRCSTEWFLPKEWAKEQAPNKLQMAGAKMESAGASLTPGIGWLAKGRKRTQIQMLEEKRDRVLSNARCPSCGSVDYRQEKA
jgi:hypothetical protein